METDIDAFADDLDAKLKDAIAKAGKARQDADDLVKHLTYVCTWARAFLREINDGSATDVNG